MKDNTYQPSLFPDDSNKPVKQPKKLTLDKQKLANASRGTNLPEVVEGIPALILPTRWELLQPKIESDTVSLQTIIRPVSQAIQIIRNISSYLITTSGCQVLVVRADSGSGKTTFLNTLPHYLKDVDFNVQTIDLQFISDVEIPSVLEKLSLQSTGVNLIILEGREKPEAIPNRYIEVVLSTINRFSRQKKLPMLFVIPTIEEQVARAWCDHAVKIGDLIPENKLYDGSRWYTFPGVPREDYINITKETVRVLNDRNIEDFGVSSDEMSQWADKAQTIGRYIEMVASEATVRRSHSMITVPGHRKEHVWTLFCAPDHRHYDHTYLVIDGLCHDEKLRLSPSKLLSPEIETSTAKQWREPNRWKRLVTTVNFLDIRLINFSITSAVSCVLAYGDEEYIDTFKKKTIGDYLKEIPPSMQVDDLRLDTQLVERRLQAQNARASLERSNLFMLLRELPARTAKGGRPEEAKTLAQYLHLMETVPISHIHLCIGMAIADLLREYQFPGFVGVETETVLVEGQTDPRPDITIHTETDVYALELHFYSKQFTSSEISRYVLRSVIDKYMKSLPHLNSHLNRAYGELK